MYRAAMFIVDDAITNPTSPMDKEAIMWKDLSPVASECLWFHVSLLFLQEQREDLPRDSERNQSREHPGRGTEQEGHSWVIPECGGEGGEEHVK